MPPGADKLDFRGIWAWDENTAVVMSSGSGDLSRIYKTTDGCSHWNLLFTNPDKDGFWDAMVFSDVNYGALLGDPVDGKFVFFETADQGGHWTRESSRSLKSEPKESAFAASNSCLSDEGLGTRWFFATGGVGGGRIFESQNKISETGLFRDWQQFRIPSALKRDSAGIFSVAFQQDAKRGIAVGGDYTKPNDSDGTAAWTTDGGQHWTPAARPPHGYRSAVAWDEYAMAWIAAGTNGSDISFDGGKTWTPLDNGNWNALSLPWVVGPGGRIAKLDPGKLPKK
jgi:photosystem II stability/assembly factor-like uncharacterized protein